MEEAKMDYKPEDIVEYQYGFNKGMGAMLTILTMQLGEDLDEVREEYPHLSEAIDGFQEIKDNIETLEIQLKHKYEDMQGKKRIFVDMDVDEIKEYFLDCGLPNKALTEK